MTTQTVVTCDFCGTKKLEPHAPWGVLQIAKQQNKDVCPGCIAELNGWKRTGVAS